MTVTTSAPRTTTSPLPAPAPTLTPTSPGLDSGYSLQTFTDDGCAVVLDDGSVWSIDSADQSTVSGLSNGDSITVGRGRQSLTNDGTGDTVTATKIGSESGLGNSYGNTGDHTLAALGDDGSVVALDDGSIWAIDAGDHSSVSSWTDGASITVNRDPAGYGYLLVNTDDHSTVTGHYLDGTRPTTFPSPSDFCSTHTCIPSFANGVGYIVQCADGEWSHSGGRPGACS